MPSLKALENQLTQQLELLSAGLQAPIWLMDSEGRILAQPSQPKGVCCGLVGESRSDCNTLRKELYDAAVSTGNVCSLKCPEGCSFLAAPTPGGGYLAAAAVVGGFRAGAPDQGADPVANAVPRLRIEEQAFLIGALPGIAQLLNDAALQRDLVPRIDEALALLSQVTSESSLPTTLDAMMEQILSLAITAPGVEAQIFELIDQGRIRTIATRGPSLAVLKGTEHPLGMGMTAWVARTSEELLVPNAEADPRAYKAKALQLPQRSWLTVPFRAAGTVCGGIQVGWLGTGIPSTLEQSLIRHLAQILGCLWTRTRTWDRLVRLERSITLAGQFLQDSRSLSGSIELSLALFKSTWGIERLTIERAAPRSLEGLPFAPAIHSQDNTGIQLALPLSGNLLRIDGGAAPLDLDENLVRIWLHLIDLSLTAQGANPQSTTAHSTDEPDPVIYLSDREREIMRLVADGASNRELAKSLFLSEATVKTHISRILRKMGVTNRSKAARMYREGPSHGGSSPGGIASRSALRLATVAPESGQQPVG